MEKNTKIKKHPTKDEIVKGKISNALTSAAKNHIVATTDDLYDTNFLEYQDEINKRVSTDIENIQSDVEALTGKVNTLQGDVDALENRVDKVQGEVEVLKTDVHNLNERVDNAETVIGGIKNDVSIINSKIPEEASSANQLADKQFVIDLIHSTSSAFRGNWETWDVVPTDSDEYPEDGEGNRIPRQGDYIVIVDASEYVGEDTGKTYEGSWRFVYEGEWDDNNKNGWKPEYQINEKPEITVHFRKKREGEEISTPITDVKVTDENTLLTYPELKYSEFVNGGYLDTDITTLRNVTGETTVYYITPFLTISDNETLLKICYNNGWSSSQGYLTINEAESITDEMVTEASKKLSLIEDKQGNLIEVFDSIVFVEEGEEPVVMTSYNLYDGLCYDKNGNKYNIIDCCCYSKDGKRYNLDEVKYGNCFYELESWAELPYFTGITKLSDGETYRVFLDYSHIRDINLENITSLPAYTLFRCTNLENIFIPSGLTDIETYAIASCDGIQSLIVDENNPKYTSRNSQGVECNCIIEKPTRRVSGLTLIQGCNISILPDNIKHIASGAFDECTRLTSITLPNGLLTMGIDGDNPGYVFNKCTALSGEIVIPDTVTEIGKASFSGCTAIQSVVTSVPVISEQLFKGCTSLSTLTLNSGVTTIDKQAFMNDTALTAVTIPDSVESIGVSAFNACGLENIDTNNVVEIGADAFANNTNLSSVTIHDCISSIVSETFYNCPNLESVTILGDDEVVSLENSNAFGECDNLYEIIVSDDLLVDYKEDDEWEDYKELIVGSTIYTVTFDSNGGETTPVSQQVVNGGYVSNPGEVHKDLYLFDCWQDASGNTWDFDNDYVSGNITLYAHYTEVNAIMVKSVSNASPTYVGISYDSEIPNVEYSLDGIEWISAIGLVLNIKSGTVNNFVYFRGINSGNQHFKFNIYGGGACTVSGNIMTLVNYIDESYWDTIPSNYYFDNFFSSCTDITDASGLLLPATTLTPYCYESMFYNCTNLVKAPALPATELTNSCYQSMFQGCTSLTEAPELPAAALVYQCYNYMFYGCTNLNYIKCMAISGVGQNNSTNSWVHGVQTDGGTFIKHPFATDWEICNESGIPCNWNSEDAPIQIDNHITFTALEDDSTVGLSRLSNSQKLWYSSNSGNTWSVFDTRVSLNLNSGNTVYICGILNGNNNYNNYTQFNISGSVAVSGNINCLWDYLNLNKQLYQYCGYRLFYGSTGLTDASNLVLGNSSTSLANYCYNYMFYNCTNLISAPEILPATTLASYCYSSMFRDCTSLMTAPELPATTLASYCYQCMFSNCTSLTAAPELPATTLAQYCYQCMFSNCTSLTTAPVLPATTLAQYCYQCMFSNCTSLTAAPELPATILTANCYSQMFQYCTSLTTAPELPATTLTDSCYYHMFYNCTNLNYVKCLATNNITESNSYMWLNRVADTGLFIKNESAVWNRSNSAIPLTWSVPSEFIPDTTFETSNYMTFTSNDGVSYVGVKNLSSNQTLYISKNAVNWMTLQSITADYPLSSGETFFVCGKLTADNNYNRYTTFNINGNVSVGGKLRALWNYENLEQALYNYCGYMLFNDSKGLTDVSTLILDTSAFTLSQYCYSHMFNGCTNLTAAPELPATTLANSCYQGMFKNCASLTTAPELPATTLANYCYSYMFEGCSNLVHIVCHALVTSGYTTDWVKGVAPSGTFIKETGSSWTIGNSGIPEGWYGIINDVQYVPTYTFTPAGSVHFTVCDSSGSSIFLKSISTNQTVYISKDGNSWMLLGEYERLTFESGESYYICGMLTGNNTPYNFTKFVINGDVICEGNLNYLWNYNNLNVDIKEYCGYYLFSSCNIVGASNLILGTSALTLTRECYSHMFYNCASLITTPELPATTLAEKCYSYMFANCSELATTHDIHGTTLADSCCEYMFAGCTSLATAPELPATSVTQYCYRYMFYGCTSLVHAPELPATTLGYMCYDDMFYNCTSLATAPKLPATTLADSCYYNMFTNCASLNYVKADFLDFGYNTSSWLSGVSENGTFVCDFRLVIKRGESYIPENWNIIEDGINGTSSNLKVTAIEDSEIKISKMNNNAKLWITDDNETWIWSKVNSGNTIALSQGDSLYLKGNCAASGSSANIVITGKAKISGTVNYIWDAFGNETTMYNQIGVGLFRDSTGLYDASELLLPATALTESCYSNMFQNCTNLEAVPALPATTLSRACYNYMFAYCTSLTTAPELPATTLVQQCYGYMFQGCRKLKYVKCLATSGVGQNNSTSSWLSGTDVFGIFVRANGVDWSSGDSGKPYGWVYELTEYNPTLQLTPSAYFNVTTNNDNSHIGVGRKNSYQTVYVSKDGINWMELGESQVLLMNSGDTFYICGNLNSENTTNNYTTLVIDGDSTISGNLNGLWDKDNVDTSLRSYCGYRLFTKCGIADASNLELPANTLANYGYAEMFNDCQTLVAAPELPATSLATGCYQKMFYNCINLINAPSTLPAESCPNYGYDNMFQYCKSLTITPEINARSIGREGCDGMFWGCTSLVSCPKLVATSASGDYACRQMFQDCVNLNYIKCLTASYPYRGFTSWMKNVAENGTFVKNPNMTSWPRGDGGIPYNWTIQDAVLE